MLSILGARSAQQCVVAAGAEEERRPVSGRRKQERGGGPPRRRDGWGCENREVIVYVKSEATVAEGQKQEEREKMTEEGVRKEV